MEVTVITTVEITEVIKETPECFTLDKSAMAEYVKGKIAEVISADDIVVANVQEFRIGE